MIVLLLILKISAWDQTMDLLGKFCTTKSCLQPHLELGRKIINLLIWLRLISYSPSFYLFVCLFAIPSTQNLMEMSLNCILIDCANKTSTLRERSVQTNKKYQSSWKLLMVTYQTTSRKRTRKRCLVFWFDRAQGRPHKPWWGRQHLSCTHGFVLPWYQVCYLFGLFAFLLADA